MSKVFTDDEKHNIHQADRMQDMLLSYSQLAIKTFGIISGGALVSLGAVFTHLASGESSINLGFKIRLIASFDFFSWAVVLIAAGLVTTFISRLSYAVHSKVYDENEDIRERHKIYGDVSEFLSLIIFVAVVILIALGFNELRQGFSSL